MSNSCTLCGLPVGADPVTSPAQTGTFCCRGCLEVARTVGDSDGTAEEFEADSIESHNTGTVDGTAEAFLAVEGMHCTACEAFLGIRAGTIEGIESLDASYATDTARIRYDPDRIAAMALPERLSGYGYTLRFRDPEETSQLPPQEETVQRLLLGGFLAMLVMPWYLFFLYPSYVGIETGILSADMTTPVGLYLPMAIVGLLSAIIVFYTGWPILRGAYVSLRTGHPTMDLLLSVAILSSFTYSTIALATGSTHLYYDVSIAIVLVVTAGGYYETALKRQALRRLSDLTTLRVREANRREPDGTTETVSVDNLSPADAVVVAPGERVPVDGTIIEGTAALDEAVVTGESLPRRKTVGDSVVGGSVVTDSPIVVEVAENADSTLERLTSLLWTVQSERHGGQHVVDGLAAVFVPLVLLIGGAVSAWQLANGEPIAAALLAGLTVLVAACPCAMGIAMPLANAAALRDALNRGIVITNSAVFEAARDVDTIVFDKTGTLTTGEMRVNSVVGDTEALTVAARLEQHASHPVANAIVEYASTAEATAFGPDSGSGLREPEEEPASEVCVQAITQHPGEGISGQVAGDSVVVGTPALIEQEVGSLEPRLEAAVDRARANGNRPVVIGMGNTPRAVVSVGDSPRPGWTDVLSHFEEKDVVILTGDAAGATESFQRHPAVDQVYAGVPPDGKVAAIESINTDGTTAMVGDGTNDAPALGAADVGIALDGTARSADAADVICVDDDIEAVPAIFDLATSTRRRIRENMAWAFCYNGIAIPLAVIGVLNPLAAAGAMTASSLLVVSNSRRPLL